nr:arylphorin subunit alpha-like [Onthophagus taurus]
MKSLVFLGLLALAWATTLKKPVYNTQEPVYPTEEFLQQQKIVYQLFQYVYQPNYLPEYEKIGLTYNLEENLQGYSNPKYVLDFLSNYQVGSLPKGQVFSIFYDKHQNEAIAFFRVLYSAVDFETFYKTAVWGRMHLNEGLYIYSLSVALVHRPDTWNLELPPIYEIYPFYFYNFNVFRLAEQKTGYYFGNYPTTSKYQYYFGKYLQNQQYPYGQLYERFGQQPWFQMSKTTPFTQQYLQKYGQYPWFSKYEQSNPVYGRYMESIETPQPWSFKYEQSYPYQYAKKQFPTQYVPYNQYQQSYPYVPQPEQYYQQYSKQYGKSYPWNQVPTQYTPYSQQYYQKYNQYPTPYGPQIEQYQKLSKLPWFSFEKYGKSYPWNQVPSQYIPYSQQYYQKYNQYPSYQYPYEPQSEQYYQQSTKLPWLLSEKYEKSYPMNQVPTQYTPYNQQYFQRYNQFPSQYMPQSKYMPEPEYRPYSPEYISTYEKYPYFQQRYPYMEQKSTPFPPSYYQKYVEEPMPESFRPYSQQYYQKYQQYPYFQMNKQFTKPMPFVNSPLYQKSIFKYTPSQSEIFQKIQYSQVPQEVPEFYQEREKIPLEYYQQGILITANFTNFNAQFNPEYQLSYFTQDIGMNAFYYYYHIYFPFWMKNEEIAFNTQRRGEQFYYIYQQLLARYNLERISNGLGEIPLLQYEQGVPVGFRTPMMYPNGMPFPERPDHSPFEYYQGPAYYDNDTLSLLNIKLYERRLLDAIDSGFVLTRDGRFISIFEPQGFEILGNLIQANPESPNARYYGPILVFARYLLGHSNYPLNQYYINPSVMEQYETSLHDPAFYQLYKVMIYYFQRFKQYMPMYTEQELLLPGVKIQDVKVDKLTTYFDYFYTDISNIMHSKGPVEDIPIQVRQYRLNHKPFNYYMNVMSEKPYEAVVRVFLGPKYSVNGEPIDINKDRMSFVELDKFQYTLVPGLNTIERNSREFYGYVPERSTYKELFMQLVNYQTPIQYSPRVYWGLPQRMMLPKGTQQGQEYQMYFLITPYQPVEKVLPRSYLGNRPHLYWDRTFDKLPYGYPFDRPIDESVFYVPNSYFKDVVIYNEFTPEFSGEYPYTPFYENY